jgi:hypothetical protein
VASSSVSHATFIAASGPRVDGRVAERQDADARPAATADLGERRVDHADDGLARGALHLALQDVGAVRSDDEEVAERPELLRRIEKARLRPQRQLGRAVRLHDHRRVPAIPHDHRRIAALNRGAISRCATRWTRASKSIVA